RPAGVGRPDAQRERGARAEPLLLVLALEPREPVPEAAVVVGARDELPDLLARRVDVDVALGAHQPSTGSERSSARPVSAVCMAVVTRSYAVSTPTRVTSSGSSTWIVGFAGSGMWPSKSATFTPH